MNQDVSIMQEAAHEIERLRSRNEAMAAQLDIVRVFQVALFGPQPPQPCSPDIVHYLRQRAAEIERAERAKTEGEKK